MYFVNLEVPIQYEVPETFPRHRSKVIGSGRLIKFEEPMEHVAVEALATKLREELPPEEFGLVGTGDKSMSRGDRLVDSSYIHWAWARH